MEDKLRISVYRHKVYKDVYLERNWNVCGVCGNTYKATNYLMNAIESANHKGSSNFTYYFSDKLTVDYKLKKEMEFDGYSGTLEKLVKLKVTDFEEVVLSEI